MTSPYTFTLSEYPPPDALDYEASREFTEAEQAILACLRAAVQLTLSCASCDEPLPETRISAILKFRLAPLCAVCGEARAMRERPSIEECDPAESRAALVEIGGAR